MHHLIHEYDNTIGKSNFLFGCKISNITRLIDIRDEQVISTVNKVINVIVFPKKKGFKIIIDRSISNPQIFKNIILKNKI